MTLNDKEVLSILKFVNESEYGFLKLEDDDFELTVIKKSMDLSDIKDIVQKGNSGNNVPKTPQYPVQVQNNNENGMPNPMQVEGGTVAEQSKDEIKTEENIYTVRAPMVGTFFSKASPEESEYVKVGDAVEQGDTVCLIEVMKLFNSVPAGVYGRVKEVLVADGELVEYDQPLFIISVDSDEETSK